MDADEAIRALSAALRRSNEANERTEATIAELRALFDILLQILAARGTLSPGHLLTLEKLRERARIRPDTPVALNIEGDKYALTGEPIDCASRLHLCHARCCSFIVRLSRQDLEEGELAWNIDDPYLLPRSEDGYCTYLTRETGGCGTYHNRPGPCRLYDCREDRRVWLDFDAMIPAPPPDGLITIRLKPPAL